MEWFVLLGFAALVLWNFVYILVLGGRLDSLEQEVRRLRGGAETSPQPDPRAEVRPEASSSPGGADAEPQPPAVTPMTPTNSRAATERTLHELRAEAPVAAEPSPTLPSPAVDSPHSATSLERLIGERWLNWTGTITLLVGVSYFLKYAYDNEWIGPLGRMLVAYAFGALAIFGGGWLRQRLHEIVGDGVTAVGLGSSYAATYFGANVYRFEWMPSPVALAITACITALGVAIARKRNSALLGTLTFIGAYASPVLIAFAADHGSVLITYLAAVATGAVTLASTRDWRAVSGIALICSYGLLLGWFDRYYEPDRMAVALGGSVTFFTIFSLGSVAPVVLSRRPGTGWDVGTLIFSSVCAFLFAYGVLNESHPLALVSGCLVAAAYCVALNRSVHRRGESGAGLAAATLLLSAFFVTVAVPVYFDLWGVPIAWSAEAVMLSLLARRFRNGWHLVGAGVALALAGAYLLGRVDVRLGESDLVFTDSFGTWTIYVGALFASAWVVLTGRDAASTTSVTRQAFTAFGTSAHAVGGVAGLLLLVTELVGPLKERLSHAHDVIAVIVLLWALFPFVYVLAAQLTLARTRLAFQVASLVAAVSGVPWFGGLLVLYRFEWVHSKNLLTPGLHPWFGAGLGWVLMLALLTSHFRREARWLASTLGVGTLVGLWLLLSRECFECFFQWRGATAIAGKWGLTSLSVLWAVYAGAVLVLGLRWQSAWLRWSSLGLFGLTVGKVFLVDTAELEAVYRVVAFLCLGAVLVGASLAYSRLARREEERPSSTSDRHGLGPDHPAA
ncbi:MAG: DUF2339 domain-containing protein [Planctomycetota bacterium]